MTRILHFVLLAKVPRTKFPFRIIRFSLFSLVPTGVENNAYAKFWREVQEYYCIFEKGILYSRLMEKQEFLSGV